MSHKKYISEYKRPYKELKEDVVVDVLVLKDDITRLLKVHSIDQRHGAVVTIWLYVISTRDPRRAVETKPRGILHARSETSYVTRIQKSFVPSARQSREDQSFSGIQQPTPLLGKESLLMAHNSLNIGKINLLWNCYFSPKLWSLKRQSLILLVWGRIIASKNIWNFIY